MKATLCSFTRLAGNRLAGNRLAGLSGFAGFALLVLSESAARADAQPWVPWAPTAGAPATPAKGIPKDDTDHDDVRLRVGVGYFGQFTLPLGKDSAAAAAPQLIGIRTWFRRAVGLDVAVGFHTRIGRGDENDASLLAVAGRVSLPIALAVTRHLTLFVAPTVGYGQGGQTEPGRAQLNPVTGLSWTPPDTRQRGLRATVGGRIGGELHLGFIGVSRLTITGSVGLDLDYLRGTTSAPPTPTSRTPEPSAASQSGSTFVARTTFSDDPWAAVLGNVALVGYF